MFLVYICYFQIIWWSKIWFRLALSLTYSAKFGKTFFFFKVPLLSYYALWPNVLSLTLLKIRTKLIYIRIHVYIYVIMYNRHFGSWSNNWPSNGQFWSIKKYKTDAKSYQFSNNLQTWPLLNFEIFGGKINSLGCVQTFGTEFWEYA